ncbi:hypothetical protein [Pseudoalteromonas sp. P1-9]|uniref:hypothetical protein n=1 Tax=Pseudoalteromonas sp. P1-9 TaxID=1710354 RepID=UPI0006D60D65|nr:hypothetical protein [Pseudoalteromonas sp. P1-9]
MKNNVVLVTTSNSDLALYLNQDLICYFDSNFDGIAIKQVVETTAENLSNSLNVDLVKKPLHITKCDEDCVNGENVNSLLSRVEKTTDSKSLIKLAS